MLVSQQALVQAQSQTPNNTSLRQSLPANAPVVKIRTVQVITSAVTTLYVKMLLLFISVRLGVLAYHFLACWLVNGVILLLR